jgi:hypothetical protein
LFQGKKTSNIGGKLIVDVKIIITEVNVMDVNVTTRRKITKDLQNQNCFL